MLEVEEFSSLKGRNLKKKKKRRDRAEENFLEESFKRNSRNSLRDRKFERSWEDRRNEDQKEK